ncbi:fimbrial protein, partial [Pseudomonas paraeruginosa]
GSVDHYKVIRTDGVTVPSLIVTLPKFTPAEFDPNIAEGTVIFSSAGTSTGTGGKISCTTPVGIVIYVGTTAAGPGKYDTYPTPVAGVGFRIRGGINPDAWWPQYHDEPTSLTYNLNAATNFTIELVKTGNITAAGQITGELGYTVALNENLIARRIMVNGSIPIRPRVPTCKLQTPTIPVNFGQLDMSEVILEAQSSFRSFELKLLCAGGETGTRTKMFVTFTDAVNPTNTSDVLSLSSGSTATGVGIQIRRDDNTAIKFGPDSTVANNVNQWKVGEYGNVEVSIPLKAGYKKTGQKVTAGTANGTATFTFSYQ